MSCSKRKIETILSGTSSVDVFEYMGNDQIVPKNVTHVRFHQSVVEVDREAFRKCKQLREVILNDGLREIGGGAFYFCESLQNITIPSSVTEIDLCAFHACSSLREVVLSNELTEIGRSVFAFCASLQSIAIPSTISNICDFAFHSCTNLRDVVLNEGLEKIGKFAFHLCKSLQRITIPSTVVQIDNDAFNNCSRLREIVIHNEGVQIGDKSFYDCTSLERFKFPHLSTRLDNIIQAGQRDIKAKMDDIYAVEWRGGELSIPANRRQIGDRVLVNPGRTTAVIEIDKEALDKVVRLIAYHEIKEASTLYELALWKAKIDQVGDTDINRDMYREGVPGPVKDRILQYIGCNT